MRACAAADCSSLLDETQFRVVTDASGAISLEVELSIARDTVEQYWLEFTSYTVVTIIPFNVQVKSCAV